MVLSPLRGPLNRSGNGRQHVALPEVQCDAHRHVYRAVWKNRLTQAKYGLPTGVVRERQRIAVGGACVLLCGNRAKPKKSEKFLFTRIPISVITPRSRTLKRGDAHRHVTLGAGCDGRGLVSGGSAAGRDAGLRTAKSCGPGAATVASIRPVS